MLFRSVGVELETTATICELLQLVMEDASVPLNLTVLLPWVPPKFDPVMVTDVPVPPKFGDTLVTKGVDPMITETLSNVAVDNDEVLPLVTANPT